MLNWRQTLKKLPPSWDQVWISPAIAIALLFASRIGYILSIPPYDVSPAWPPAGLALAIALYLGSRASWEFGWAHFSSTSGFLDTKDSTPSLLPR